MKPRPNAISLVGIICSTFITIALSLSIAGPLQEINPCLEVECEEGWVCKPVELPHCKISPIQGDYCNPTPVCLPAPKIGSCPVKITIAEVERICDTMLCFQDDNCPGDEKCCNTDDCGMVCRQPQPTMQ